MMSRSKEEETGKMVKSGDYSKNSKGQSGERIFNFITGCKYNEWRKPPPHFPAINTVFLPRLAPLALETRRILIHLQCQNLPGKVSLRRLLNHLSEPITPGAVKANSKQWLTHRHPQLGECETKHENRIKLRWPFTPTTCNFHKSNQHNARAPAHNFWLVLTLKGMRARFINLGRLSAKVTSIIHYEL